MNDAVCCASEELKMLQFKFSVSFKSHAGPTLEMQAPSALAKASIFSGVSLIARLSGIHTWDPLMWVWLPG